MTCAHFRPSEHFSVQHGAGWLSGTTDVCLLLLPSEDGHEERRRALRAMGHELAPVPFDCPFARDEQWRNCPYFGETGPSCQET